jgi:hypothetical protein
MINFSLEVRLAVPSYILSIPYYSLFIYSLVILPFYARQNHNFNLLHFLITLSIVGFISFIVMNIFYTEIFFFLVLILTLLIMGFKEYKYIHYYFFILSFIEIIFFIMRKGYRGEMFSLHNLGFIAYLSTLVFFSIYIVSKKHFKLKNILANIFGLSLSLMTLSLILWDAKQSNLYFKIFKKYEIHENIIISLLGFSLLLFFYGVYALFLEDRKGYINE